MTNRTNINWDNTLGWVTHLMHHPIIGFEYAIEIGGKFYTDPQMMEGYDLTEWTVQCELPTTTTSTDYLQACIDVQTERGKQYDAKGTGERSFAAAAEAFNAITGRDLKGSDVCLILEMVKNVRQYSDPSRLHSDSVLDKVSYASLWAEELTKELSK